VRAKHGDVVGDGLRIGRPDADVDHRDAAAAASNQVIGRHLRQPRRRGAEFVAGLGRHAGRALDHVAGFDERFVARCSADARHRFVPQPHELVDVELVVREQHEVLEVLGVGAGVVAQPVQRVVDPRRGEQRERHRLARPGDERAVRDAVVHRAEIGQIEQVAHQQAPVGVEAALDVVVLGEREMHGDRLHARSHLERDGVVLEQQAKLLAVVAGEEVGPRERGLVGTRAGNEAVAQT